MAHRKVVLLLAVMMACLGAAAIALAHPSSASLQAMHAERRAQLRREVLQRFGVHRSEEEVQTVFANWMREHNRVYSSHQLAARYAVFKDTLAFVDAQNNNPTLSYKSGLNEFSDQAPENITFGPPMSLDDPQLTAGFETSSPMLVVDAPAEVDWRKRNVVGPVKHQGGTYICFMFATLSAIETAHAIATNTPVVPLAEQNMQDCANDARCDGANGRPLTEARGTPEYCMNYVGQNGVCASANYPFTGTPATCRKDTCGTKYGMGVKGAALQPREDNEMLDAMSRGPVTVWLDATGSAFWSYKSGIFHGCDMGMVAYNHAVMLVGYGKGTAAEGGMDYWIVRNTYGPTWGEQGYMRLQRGVKMCSLGWKWSTPAKPVDPLLPNPPVYVPPGPSPAPGPGPTPDPTCPNQGQCKPCVYTSQCARGLFCSESLKLCVASYSTSCPSTASAQCRPLCPETTPGYPQACARAAGGSCQNAKFPATWMAGCDSPTPTPTPTPTCADRAGYSKVCRSWASQGFCTNPQTTAALKVACPYTCGTCPTTAASTEPDSNATSCTDKFDKCPEWAAINCAGIRRAATEWYETYCPDSCNNCGQALMRAAVANVPDKCEDTQALCKAWAERGECDRNPSYMRAYCMGSCGVCAALLTDPQLYSVFPPDDGSSSPSSPLDTVLHSTLYLSLAIAAIVLVVGLIILGVVCCVKRRRAVRDQDIYPPITASLEMPTQVPMTPSGRT